MPYAEKLLRLGLWTLEERRNRCDLIEVVKMFYGYTEIDGGAENAGQDIAGQDNDGQEKHHA